MPGNRPFGNAARPLAIATYDGSGQCVHPDVIAIRGAFYPFTYAMVIEPYPYGDASRENPSALASDDGLCWQVPPGVANPIVPAPAEAGGWHSDADMVNHRNDTLSVYFRYNSGRGETTLLRTTSDDGLDWTPARPLFTVAASGRFASPAIVEWRGGLHMLYVDTIDHRVRAARSADGIRWTEDRPLFHFPGAWHLDACVDGDLAYALVNDGRSLFLLRTQDLQAWTVLSSGDERDDPGRWTPLADGVGAPLLQPSAGGWDGRRIYRASGLPEGRRLRVWYSAESVRGEWRVGYTDGYLPE
jgi:hypothetical protein